MVVLRITCRETPETDCGLLPQCQQVLFQYLEFLLTHFTPEQVSGMMPSVEQLWNDFGLDASVSFQIVRPTLRQAIQVSFPLRPVGLAFCFGSRN